MIREQFYYCPKCGKKIQSVEDDTLISAKIFCRFCKNIEKVTIINGKEYVPKDN